MMQTAVKVWEQIHSQVGEVSLYRATEWSGGDGWAIWFLIHHLIFRSPWRFWDVHSYVPSVGAARLAPWKSGAVTYPVLKGVRFTSSCLLLFSPWTLKRWFFNLAPWLRQQAYLCGKRGAVKMLSLLWLFSRSRNLGNRRPRARRFAQSSFPF